MQIDDALIEMVSLARRSANQLEKVKGDYRARHQNLRRFEKIFKLRGMRQRLLKLNRTNDQLRCQECGSAGAHAVAIIYPFSKLRQTRLIRKTFSAWRICADTEKKKSSARARLKYMHRRSRPSFAVSCWRSNITESIRARTGELRMPLRTERANQDTEIAGVATCFARGKISW